MDQVSGQASNQPSATAQLPPSSDLSPCADGSQEFTVGDGGLLQHVGRSLTIHDGPGYESSTIAAAACGLANPDAEIDTMGVGNRGGGLSGGVIFLIVLLLLVAFTFHYLSTAYYYRWPIPFCGKFIYARTETLMKTIPPPPPQDPPPPPGGPGGTGIGMVQVQVAHG